jgi:cyclase
MKRTMTLTTLVIVGALSAAIAGRQQAPGAQKPRVVEVEKLRDNLFMLKGGGGNTAVFVMANGVAVVDTKNPGWGQPILDRIKELTDKPITTIINTHTHGDHVSGNVEFPTTVEVIAHENAAASMKRMKNAEGANIFETNGGRGLPKRTYKDTLSIGKGADQIDLYYFGRGHTDGDTWIVFPSLRFMHAGDIFSGKNLPLLDLNNGGTGIEIGATLAKAHSSVKGVDSIITGHSTVMTMADLKEYADFNNDFMVAVQEAKKAGQTPSQIIESWKMPAKYSNYTAPQPARLQANVEAVYNAVK